MNVRAEDVVKVWRGRYVEGKKAEDEGRIRGLRRRWLRMRAREMLIWTVVSMPQMTKISRSRETRELGVAGLQA